MTDAELRPVSWNASALRILGVTPRSSLHAEGLAGGAIGALRCGDGPPRHARRQPAVRRAMRQGSPVRATLRRTPPEGAADRWITAAGAADRRRARPASRARASSAPSPT